MTNDPWSEHRAQVKTSARSKSRPMLVKLGALVALTVFVAVVALAAYSLMREAKPAKKQVVQIALLAPPPPPPPPPPPEVTPPEPEVKQDVKIPEPEQPQQAEEAPPPGEQLGLDADGSGDGDSFGLVGKKGGQDITTIGAGGGNSRARFTWFAGMVENQLQEHLGRNDKLRKSGYRVVMRVWFRDDGRIERYELVGSSGDADIDRSLKMAMDGMPRLKQPPPPDLPQPIKLRVTARGAG
jgi:protein TonB